MSISDLGWLAQPAVFPWVALALGLCIGSFLNVLIHRLPKMMEREWQEEAKSILEPVPDERKAWLQRKSLDSKKIRQIGSKKLVFKNHSELGTYNLLVPRSACPVCGHHIPWWENIPVLSYIALRGKCSDCKTGISARYPIVELLTGVGTAYAAAHFGFSLAALGASFFVWSTIALALIDQKTGYLPDDITLPLVWVGLLLNTFIAFVPLTDAVIGAAAGYLVLWLVYWGFKLLTGKEGMGYGDFKMNAAVGAFLGWKVLPIVILVSSVVGLIFGGAQMLAARGRWDGNFRFHFGPYIAIAGIVTMFWGRKIMEFFPGIQILP